MPGARAPAPVLDPEDRRPIDPGTRARTTMPSARGRHSPATRKRRATTVLDQARRHTGKRVGDGECFALADQALRKAGYRTAKDFAPVTADADYVWGKHVSLDDVKPGDIIQFRNHRADGSVSTRLPDGSGTAAIFFEEREHHTAIVVSVQPHGVLEVIEQNVPPRGRVRKLKLPFRSEDYVAGQKHHAVEVSGTVWFYRPQPR